MAPAIIAALTLTLASLFTPVAVVDAAARVSVEVAEALAAADDECDVAAHEGHCALSAVQLRGNFREHKTAWQPKEECFTYQNGGDVCVGEVLAKRFRLTNVKYDEYRMYFPTMFHHYLPMKATKADKNDQEFFNLYNWGKGPDGKRTYAIGSVKWPGMAVGIKHAWGTAANAFGTFALHWGPNVDIGLHLCSVGPKSSRAGAVQIAAQISGKTVWAYMDHGAPAFGDNYIVHGASTNPGEAGQWIPDPPLPADLQLPLCD